MENIRKNLSENYKSAIAFFNVGDYKHFFGDIRVCIEWFFKFMIHEVLNDEALANDIIDGKNSINLNRNTNCWILTNIAQEQKPEGTFFAKLLKSALFYKYSQLWDSNEKTMRRQRNYCEVGIDKLSNYYSVASELRLHTGSTNLDLITQATGCANDFSTIFDQIKGLFPQTYSLFSQFPKADIVSASRNAITIETDLNQLYNETNHFCAMGGDKFILLLPSEYSLQQKSLADSLVMMPCSLICDLGIHNEKDIASAINTDIWRNRVHPVKTKDDFIVASSMVNWYFCRGEENVGEQIAYDFKSWKVNKGKNLVDIFTNVAKKNNATHFFILNFIDEPKYAPYIFEKFTTVFGDESCAKNRCDIFSFTDNAEVKKGLEQWAEDSIVSHKIFNITLEDFLHEVNSKSSMNNIGVTPTVTKAKIEISQEEVIMYKEAGIDVWGSYITDVPSKYDFYYGAEISWKELAADLDVKRSGYEKFKQNIISIINNPKQKTVTYTLKHHPGAGGTTMVRRLAYDLLKLSSEVEGFSCLPIFLNFYNEKTYEYLLQLSEKKLENDFLIIIVEGGNVADENLNKLTIRLNSRQRNVIILRVFRTTKQNIQGGLNVTTLSSILNEEDVKLFVEKYSIKNGKPIFSQEEIDKGLEVVDFPLKLNDDITSDRLNDYVSAFMDDMSEQLRLFTGYVAFVTYYADRPLNQNLVKGILDYNTSNWGAFEILKRLLIQELDDDDKPSGCWRPRYQSFALPIINKVWGMDWKLRVNKISTDFIMECKKNGTIGQWDKDMLYSVFVLRRGSDFKEATEESRPKFAKLIQDVMDNNQRPEEIYNALIDTYPDDSIFLSHYGRFLYEQAYVKNVPYNDELYTRAEDLISSAITISPNDDNDHMKGMLYLRKIQSVGRCLSAIKKDSSFDVYDFEDLIQKWMIVAKESFESSIEKNPASPYGYTAQCQLYSECLKLSKDLKDEDDYSFCDNDPMYMQIVELLGSSLNKLGNICQTYDEGQIFMKQSFITYNRIRGFHRQVIGNPQAAVDHYRKLYESSANSNKVFYGKQFVTSILYARTDGLKNNKNKNNMAWAMGHLSSSDRIEVSKVLQYQRIQNDIDSYESLFWFKLSGNEEFPLDEAINLLVEWLHQYEYYGKGGGGKLKAAFYLAVCYSALAINCNSYNEDYIKNAKKYFKMAGELAESFEKSSLTAIAYMGEENDAHCILQPSQVEEAQIFEAVISKIDRRKGYVKLSCGLEAFFPNSDYKYNSLADEGKTYLIGKIAFRYGGLGFYKLDEVVENTFDQKAEISDYCDRKADYGTEKTQNEEDDVIENLAPSIRKPTIVGEIDLSQYEKKLSLRNRINMNVKRYEEGEIVRGTICLKDNIVVGPKGRCTIDKEQGFAIGFLPSQCDYEVIEHVNFRVKVGQNKNNLSKPWYYAIDIKPDE